MNRLYCSNSGGVTRYCVAEDKEKASEVLGTPAKKPNEDELRRFWEVSGLADMSPSEAAEQIGVSRQTIWGWRRRIGATCANPIGEAWKLRRAMVLDALEIQSITGVAREFNVPRSTVQKIARLAGYGGGHAIKKA